MARIGYIGLGLMGSGIARNLMKAGHTLVVHNRSRAIVDQFAQEGAIPATSPREVAAQSEFVFTNLPDTPDVVVRVRSIANNGEFHVGGNLLERLPRELRFRHRRQHALRRRAEAEVRRDPRDRAAGVGLRRRPSLPKPQERSGPLLSR